MNLILFIAAHFPINVLSCFCVQGMQAPVQLVGDARELYQEVFKVLDQLGWADLRGTFQEHCIQVTISLLLSPSPSPSLSPSPSPSPSLPLFLPPSLLSLSVSLPLPLSLPLSLPPSLSLSPSLPPSPCPLTTLSYSEINLRP